MEERSPTRRVLVAMVEGRRQTEGQAETEMGRWCDGRCQEVGGKKLEECCKVQGQLAEASEEGLGSKEAVVPMMMMYEETLTEHKNFLSYTEILLFTSIISASTVV